MLYEGLISIADSGEDFQTTNRVKIYGVGTYNKGLYVSYAKSGSKSVITREYNTWRHMLQRGHCSKYKLKNSSYADVTTVSEFRDFQKFCLWGKDQVGFGLQGYCLDKDILVKGNKIYGPDFCAFVPQEINKLFTRREAMRGEFPIGVSIIDGRYFIARLNIGQSKEKYLGSFASPREAFDAYKVAKEIHIKQVADNWKASIDSKVHLAMYKYEVEFED
jgi:hypothetical protein